VDYLGKRNINRTLAVLGVIIMVIALISLFTVLAGKAIGDEFTSFYETLSEYIKEAPEQVENIFQQDEFLSVPLEDIESRLLELSQVFLEIFRENISAWITNITDLLAIVILIPIVVFFWLRDDKLFYEKFMKLVPGRLKEKTKDIFEEIDMVLQNYFVGQLMVAGVLGVLTYIGYLIIGLPNALFLSIFSMIFSIIPFLGPLVGILPAIFIGWTVDLFMIAKVIIVLAITQQLEGNVVRPKIMGTRLEIHPLAIIFLVIIAVTQFGFMGAFFVIPLYAVARIVIRNILEDAK
jgi:predicted PurR-regulated permease PerM